MNYENFTVAELQSLADNSDNKLAIRLANILEEVSDLILCLEIPEDQTEMSRDIEWIKRTLNLENNW